MKEPIELADDRSIGTASYPGKDARIPIATYAANKNIARLRTQITDTCRSDVRRQMTVEVSTDNRRFCLNDVEIVWITTLTALAWELDLDAWELDLDAD